MLSDEASNLQPERLEYVVGQKINPPPQLTGRRGRMLLRPKLKDVEIVAHFLLNSPGEWFVVELAEEPVSKTSALAMALYRRGFEVTKRAIDAEQHWVFARWTHAIPVFPDGYMTL